MNVYVVNAIGLLLILTAFALTRARDLFAVVALLAVYSGLLAVLLAMLGAVDVAFTEAVVGTGVSTLFFMALIRKVDTRQLTRRRTAHRLLAGAVTLSLGGVLFYAMHALPPFAAADTPYGAQVEPDYIERSYQDTHTPNVVTAVLGDYRSFDTLIETTVVFTAAVACLLILRPSVQS